MTLMWMIHAAIINKIWHSRVLLLMRIKKRTFIEQNKSTFLILHPVFRIFRAIRSFANCQYKWLTNVSCQLDFKIFAICHLSVNPIQTLKLAWMGEFMAVKSKRAEIYKFNPWKVYRMLSNRYALTSLGKTALLVENILTNIICIPYEYRHVIAQTRTSAHDARAIVNQFMAPFFMVSCFHHIWWS